MPVIELWAKDAYLSTPDGNSIYFWGFSKSENGAAQIPGPNLIVKQGDIVTVKLYNTLSEPVSISFPGQTNVTADGQQVQPQYTLSGQLVSFVNHAEPQSMITYEFTANYPGTYIYESGTNPSKQVPLGLHGGLIVRPADYNPNIKEYKTAYGFGTDSEYDREYLLITGEIDPNLHEAVEANKPYEISQFLPRYWTLNGRCAPDTMLMNSVDQLPHQPYSSMIMTKPGEKVLIRYIGAGVQNHPLHPHGNFTRVIAKDGRLLRNGSVDLSYERFTVLVGVGQTYDQIFQWDGLGYTPNDPIPTVVPNLRNMGIGEAGWTLWSGSPYFGEKGPIPQGVTSLNEFGEYYFMLHSHEEMQITNWGDYPGGMMTMIGIYPSLSDQVGVLE